MHLQFHLFSRAPARKNAITPVFSTSLFVLLVHTFSLASPVVLNSRKKTFKNILPSKTITLKKVYDPATKRISILSDASQIQSAADLFRMEEADREAYRSKIGRIEENLASKIQIMSGDERKRVIVILKPPEGIVYLDKFSHSTDELKQNSLQVANAKPVRSLNIVLSPYGVSDVTIVSDYTAIVNATAHAISAIAKDGDVAGVIEYVPETITMPYFPVVSSLGFAQTSSDNYNTLSRSAYSHSQTAVPSLGNQVHGATFESGLTQNFLSCSAITPVQWDPQSVPYSSPEGADPSNGLHSLSTFYLMVIGSPGSKYYHRRSWEYSSADDVNFIIGNGINSVSVSVGGHSDVTTYVGNFDPTVMNMDDFAYRYPYPTFVTPTGNQGYMYSPIWSGAYNQINVGNVQDSNFNHFTIPINDCDFGNTQTRNPIPIYGSCIDGGQPYNYCAGDREMPYIVAPGWAPRIGTAPIPNGNGACADTGRYIYSGCTGYQIRSGTSASAPTANAMVLNLLGQKSFLVNYPELTRAIIIETARNVTGGYWDRNLDGRDGNGVIHGLDAINFAKAMVSVYPNGTAVQNGFWLGSMTASDFNGSVKNFNIQIPSALPSGKHLRVVLTWDSSPDLVASIDDLSDLDLLSNATNLYSQSWDGNIEVLDFPTSKTPPGSVQSIQVAPWTWRHHANARSGSIYTALVWTFVSDHAH